MAKKTKAKHHGRRSHGQHGGAPSRSAYFEAPGFAAGMIRADALIGGGFWDEARSHLEALAGRFPREGEIQRSLVHAYHELGDTEKYEQACERLLELEPDEPDAVLAVAHLHVTHLRLVTARDLLTNFLARWPEDERAKEARTLLDRVESDIAEHVERTGLTEEQHNRAMGLHEQALKQAERGRFREARQLEERALSHAPGLVPALNTLSSLDLLDSHLANAIAKTRRVLEADPHNVIGLANMVRFHVISGHPERAAPFGERLKLVTSVAPDAWIRKSEAFSYLGDAAAVWAAYEEATAAGHTRSDTASPVGLHLAAVAAWQLGRESDARRLWQRALKREPDFEPALRNLADLKLPVGERDGPWPFSFEYWITMSFREDLQKLVASANPSRDLAVAKGRVHGEGIEGVEGISAVGDSDEVGDTEFSDAAWEGDAAHEEAVERALTEVIRAHPELPGIVPLLLDRGDPMARKFAVRIANVIRGPEMAAALRDFALSQRGTDQLRMDATRLPTEEGLLPTFRPIRLWTNGQWTEIMLMNMEISFEPIGELPPEIEPLVRDGVLAMRAGDPERALSLYERARQLDPNIPSVLNNLAGAYGALGRDDEARALSREVHRRFPDYFFGRVTMARMAIEASDLETAKAMLEPLLSQHKLHIDEFSALADTEIGLSEAMGEREGAESWLKIWEGIAPDDPRIQNWRLRLRLDVRDLIANLERIQARMRGPRTRKNKPSGARKPRGQR